METQKGKNKELARMLDQGILENERLHVKESLLAEGLAGLLQKLIRMTDEEFAMVDKQRADWE